VSCRRAALTSRRRSRFALSELSPITTGRVGDGDEKDERSR
jgi:hypothetical protein